MNIQKIILNQSFYNWKSYIKLSDEKLNKKINFLFKVNTVLYITAIIMTFISPFFMHYILINMFLECSLAYRLLISFLTMVLTGLSVIYIAQGNLVFVQQFVPINKDSKYQIDIDTLNASSLECRKWSNQAKEIGRTLRFFDIELMQSFKKLEDLNEQIYKDNLRNKVLEFKTLKVLS